jgi:hypothetical protein
VTRGCQIEAVMLQSFAFAKCAEWHFLHVFLDMKKSATRNRSSEGQRPRPIAGGPTGPS